MTSLTRWRLLSGLLVALLTHAWWPHASRAQHTASRLPRAGAPLRVSAAAAGISLDDLVAKLLDARDVDEVRGLAETLGTVGDDHAIDRLIPLLTDTRAGVPEAMLTAFGKIGTDHAIEVIVPYARDARADLRVTALESLGTARNPHAEPALIGAAEDGSLDLNVRTTALASLGALGTDGAVAVLEQQATVGVQEIMTASIAALAEVDTPASHEAVARLIDSPSVEVARAALGAIKVVDDALFAKLAEIIAANDHALNDRAIDAIAHAGLRALPILRRVAALGPADARSAAIAALATIDSPEAFDTLRNLVEEDDADVVAAVLTAISAMQTDEARDLLISAALSDIDSTWTRALDFLLARSGADVDEALIEVVKQHPSARPQVLRHLVAAAHPQGTALALELAHSSDDAERLTAIRIFAEAGTSDSLATALSLVRNEHGDIKPDALAMLDSVQPGDPSVLELLRDTVRTGTTEEAKVALRVLGRSGTTEARDIIISALTSSDVEIVGTAVSALEKFRLTPEMTMALRSVADAHHELRVAVMQQLFTSGSPVAIEIAEALIHSSERYDVECAFRALEQSGSSLATDLLVRVASDRDPETRAQALRSLTYGKDKRAVEIAVRALRDQDPYVRQAATGILANAHTDASRNALLDLSRSTDDGDRMAAVSALRGSTDDRTLSRMLELAHDTNYNVAYNALEMYIDYSNNPRALRELVTNAAVHVDLRLRAGNALREHSRSDPGLDAMIEGLEAERYGY